MSENEAAKKILRSVLQSAKDGVPLNRLQSECKALCGEDIPLQKLGYPNLGKYVQSIPSVVRLENCMGELRCFAAVCEETAHIAELVAKQKRPKNARHAPQVTVRVKRSDSSMFDENPPAEASVLHRPESRPYNVELVQSRISKILLKYCSGLWISRLSEVYSLQFDQQLHPQVLIDVEKWTSICVVEKMSSKLNSRHVIYPALPASATPRSPARSSAVAPQAPLCSNVAVDSGGDGNAGQTLPSARLKQKVQPLAPTWTSPASTNAPSPPSSNPGPDKSSSNSAHGSPSPPLVIPAEVRRRLKELLNKCTKGLWVSALPKLYMETYKTTFPEYILDNLSLLLDICNVEHITTQGKTKVILYCAGPEGMEATRGQGYQRCSLSYGPSGVEIVGPVVPPALRLPTEQYPSVLVTEATSGNTVTVRYVGENYSNTQEAMEAEMLSFYNQNPALRPISKHVIGQLVAVRDEDAGDVTRAQVMEVIPPDKVKVYYVDHGFSATTAGTSLLELHQDYLSSPFQAIAVRLAGLEAFGSHPLLQTSLDNLAVEKVLLMEIIQPSQKNEMPVVVLYDTSQDDDVIINAACLMTLRDTTMNNPLPVNSAYSDVSVTNVSPDGIICCQLPSRGAARLCKLLEKTEAVFMSQTTSESLVSRPFTGKFCLARHEGKWSRVEITKMHGNRVMELLFIDFGVPATVEVTDLREIPPGLLKDITVIPPQVTKCRLADLSHSARDWSPDVLLWVKDAVLGRERCTVKVTGC
ncbi:tudor domain-containing protein 7A [Brachionichthys hirsutus]|uniref:tudor domain-containing protein 7A n=1 Tax=Brachionichthys hirsutus TaxID=412623 RepID=UPI003604489D